MTKSQRFVRPGCFLLDAILLAAPALPAQTQPKTVIIHAGHVLDVKTGKLLDHQTIVITDGKIARGPAPADAAVIELPNATVLPGLIDAHTHLTFDPTDVGYSQLGISIPRS